MRRRRGRRVENREPALLFGVLAPEVGFEDLHNADELLHLIEAAAQLGFPSPGSLQPRLRLREPISQILHHHRPLFVLKRRRRLDEVVSRRESVVAVAHGSVLTLR